MVTARELKGLPGGTLENGRDHKSNLIRAFIASQKRHTSAYATEGKKEYLRWIKDCDDEDSNPAKQNLQTEVFSSPILKPSNANCPSVIQRPTLPTSKENFSSRRENKRDRVAQTSAKKDQSVETATKSKKSVPPPAKADSGKDKTKMTSKLKTRKRECLESDGERGELLAQRRERRRRKKEIISPQTHDEEEVPKSEEGHDAFGSVKQSKKGKKGKLPAGLALMHGFSAENIGKRRLTAPMTTSGVFNKGRASMKAKVEKKKTAKDLGTFNELDFLNKAPNSVRRKDRTARETYERQVDSCNSTDSTLQRKGQNRCGHGDSSTELSRSIRPSEEPSISRSSSDVKSDYASQVWEIEKEFLQDEADPGKASIPEPPGSFVVNSREWDWCVSEAPENEKGGLSKSLVNGQEQNNELIDPSCSSTKAVSTISPSQSASQIAEQVSRSPVLRTTSKFFTPTEKDAALSGNVSSKGNNTPFEQHAPPGETIEPTSDQKTVSSPSILIQGPGPLSDKEDASLLKVFKEPEADVRGFHRLETTMDDLEAEVLSALGIRTGYGLPCPEITLPEENIRPQFSVYKPQLSPDTVPESCGFETSNVVMGSWPDEDAETPALAKSVDGRDTYSAFGSCTFDLIEPETTGIICDPEDRYYDGLDYACDSDYADLDYMRLDQTSSTNHGEERYLEVYSNGEIAGDLEDLTYRIHDADAEPFEGSSNQLRTCDSSDIRHGGSEIDRGYTHEGAYFDDTISEDLSDDYSESHEELESVGASVHLFEWAAAPGPVGTLKEAEVVVAREFQKKFYPVKF